MKCGLVRRSSPTSGGETMTAPEHGAQLRRNQQGNAKQPGDTERSFPQTHAPLEVRFTFRADSARRDIVWRDSTQSQSFAVPNAFPAFPVYSYAPFELIYARGAAARDSVLAIGLACNAVSVIGLQPFAGD